jgi:hypothetical protein
MFTTTSYAPATECAGDRELGSRLKILSFVLSRNKVFPKIAKP